MKIKKPSIRIPKLPRNKHTNKFNPKEPVDIFNPYPQSKWPHKYNAVVFYIETRGGACEIKAGRVSWYHPAREGIDRSCCITEGCPFFTVRSTRKGQNSCDLPSADLVFPATTMGWRLVLIKLSCIYNQWSCQQLKYVGEHKARAEEYTKLSDDVFDQAKEVWG